MLLLQSLPKPSPCSHLIKFRLKQGFLTSQKLSVSFHTIANDLIFSTFSRQKKNVQVSVTPRVIKCYRALRSTLELLGSFRLLILLKEQEKAAILCRDSRKYSAAFVLLLKSSSLLL